MVCNNICEAKVRECCHVTCRPVCETHYRECCTTTCRPVCETVMKNFCCTEWTNEQVTCYKNCVRYTCEPCTTMRTVTRKVPEMVTENVCVRGKLHISLERGCHSEFDPCCCACVQKRNLLPSLHVCREPDQMCTRQVCKYRTVCEQVPCTTYVRKCHIEQVPYTVCRKVPHTVTKEVPVTETRYVRETVKKQVPYTVTRIERDVVRTQVPYTVSRRAYGAWMGAADAAAYKKLALANVESDGVVTAAAKSTTSATPSFTAYDNEAPGRVFVEGAQIQREVCYTTVRMVPETTVVKVPYTVTRTVPETITKTVPYTVVRMVPTTVKKIVPETTCKIVTEECVKNVPTCVCTMQTQTVECKVPYTVCKQVPYTVCVKVPYQVTEMVPTTVRKTVQVCVPYEVCVRKPRWEACVVPCEPCANKCNPCGNACGNVCGNACAKACETGCGNQCGCGRHRLGLLQRLFHRRFCCEPTCDSCCK